MEKREHSSRHIGRNSQDAQHQCKAVLRPHKFHVEIYPWHITLKCWHPDKKEITKKKGGSHVGKHKNDLFLIRNQESREHL